MNSSGGGFIFKSRKKKVQKGTLRSTLAKRTDQIELLDGWSCRHCATRLSWVQPTSPTTGSSRRSLTLSFQVSTSLNLIL